MASSSLQHANDCFTNSSKLLHIGFSWAVASILAANRGLRILCIVNPKHILTPGNGRDYEYLKYVGKMFPDRFEAIFCTPANMINQLCCNGHELKTFDAIYIADPLDKNAYDDVIMYTISSLRYLANDAIVIFENSANSVYFRDSTLFSPQYYAGDAYQDTTFTFHRPKITICSLAIGEDYQKDVHVCTATKMLYASKHKYTYYTDDACVDKTRPLPWSKIKCIQAAFQEHPDTEIVVWMDGDAMINNLCYTFDEILLLFPRNKTLLIGKDLYNINTGVFMIKNRNEGHIFLKKVYAQVDNIHDVWWEQAAMIKLLTTYYNDIVHVLQQPHTRIINGYPECVDSSYPTREQDFIVHFPSLKKDKLQAEMNKIVKNRKHPNYAVMWSNLMDALKDAPFVLPIYPTLKETVL